MKAPLIRYIRDAKNNPIGCVVAVDTDRVGWSFKAPHDQWNKRVALEIAAGRAVFDWQDNFPNRDVSVLEEDKIYTIPASVVLQDNINRMKQRAEKYFGKNKKSKSKKKD